MSTTLKPFYVTFSYSAVVMAANAVEASLAAESYANEIVRDDAGGPSIDEEVEVKSIAHLERLASGTGWDRDCFAYGRGSPRLGDILPDEDPPERDTKTIDMFGGGA